MKKVFNFLIVFVTLQATALTLFGQTKQERERLYYKDNGSGVCYSKTISEPDNNGIYTITLESLVTGNVKIQLEDQPVDLVLVLDVSGSMDESVNGVKKIKLLKDAVTSFINTIYNNAIYEDWKDTEQKQKERTTHLKNHISIVKYACYEGYQTYYGTYYVTRYYNDNENAYEHSGNGNHTTNVPTDISSTGIVNYAEVVRGLTLVETGKDDLIQAVNSLNPGGATAAERGMRLALNVLNHDTNTKNNKVVVLFTDGQPNHGRDFGYTVARDAVNTAYSIKQNTDDTKKATIYTVGVFGGMNQQMQSLVDGYMDHMSSNYPDATATANNSSITYAGNKTSGADFYKKSTGSDLTSVFTKIAEASGGSSNSLLSSTTNNVDIVSASFSLPSGTTPSSIRVSTAPCIGVQPGIVNTDTTYKVQKEIDGVPTLVDEHWLKFGADTLKPSARAKYEYIEEGKPTRFVDVDDSISVDIKGNVITVNGFNYSGNWCGFNASTGKYQGRKIIIEIPIEMSSTAVGGVGKQTNDSGSGIFAKGATKPVVTFDSPVVSLPVNLHINKQGLNVGESAKFLIQRAVLPDDWTKPSSPSSNAYDNLEWEDVTSVFVTRHSGQGINDPVTKVRGLPSENGAKQEYVYRIVEDTNWAWSYGNHTIINGIYTSDQLVTNPFKFNDVKKEGTKVRHAESKATNTFKEGGHDEYDDSKNNNRTVIIVE